MDIITVNVIINAIRALIALPSTIKNISDIFASKKRKGNIILFKAEEYKKIETYKNSVVNYISYHKTIAKELRDWKLINNILSDYIMHLNDIDNINPKYIKNKWNDIKICKCRNKVESQVAALLNKKKKQNVPKKVPTLIESDVITIIESQNLIIIHWHKYKKSYNLFRRYMENNINDFEEILDHLMNMQSNIIDIIHKSSTIIFNYIEILNKSTLSVGKND